MAQIAESLQSKSNYLIKKNTSSSSTNDDSLAINSHPIKFLLYSGHDTNLYNILSIMGIFNRACIMQEFYEDRDIEGCYRYIPFASDLIFELKYDS